MKCLECGLPLENPWNVMRTETGMFMTGENDGILFKDNYALCRVCVLV